jgi:HK97 family phage major capsid protein
MKNSKQLKEERAIVSDTIETLSKVDNRTPEQTAELRKAIEKEENLSKEVEASLELEKRAAEQAKFNASVSGNAAGRGDEHEARNFSFGKLVKDMVENRSISGLEKEVIEESNKEQRTLGGNASGLYLSNRFLTVEKRAMTAGSATAGGNWIPTDKIPFFDALYAMTVLESLGATMLTGLAANTDLVGFATGVTAAWTPETTDAGAGDPTTASRSITPYRLAAYTDLSKQLLIQDNYSIEQYLIQSFMKAFAVKIEGAAINGSGSGEPYGVLNTANIGSVSIGTNGGAPTLAKILEIVQTTESNNAGMNGKWLANPKVVAKLKQTQVDAGSGAMLMAYGPYFGGVENQIDSKPAYSTSNVPSNLDKGTTTGVCSALIYGTWDNLVVGQYGGIDLVVDNMSQAIGGKNRIVMNQYVGVAVKQPKTFTACKDITTT